MQRFVNNFASELAEPISDLTPEIRLPAGGAVPLPDLSGADDYMLLTIEFGELIEIVKVTALAGGDVLSVNRAQEGTIARTWQTGTRVEGRATAATLQKAVDLNRILTQGSNVLVNADGNVLTAY